MNKFIGFTLFESLVYLAVLTILLSFSIPLSHFFYQKNEVEVVAGDVINAILYARNIALKEGTPVTLNPFPISKDWSSGMVLFVDNSSHHYSENDKIIHQWQWRHKGVRVTGFS
jgi:Tfp pilus assembly protein FimT